MCVRRFLLVAAALLSVMLLSAGCGDRGAQVAAETDDPYYVQGVQFKRQGRNPEALTSFLKLIDKRGERGAAESHLQAGEIYLNHIKEPVYAYYHFRKYLELQPNSGQAELVRGMVKAALREFAKTVPGRPLEEQSLRLQADEELSKMRKENEELRAELAVLRGGGAAPVARQQRVIPLPPQSVSAAPVPTNPVLDSPITAAPVRAPSATASPQPATAVTLPGVKNSTTASASRPPGATAKSPSPSTPSGGRTHTVVAKDTLFSLSKKYNVKMEDLAAANGLPSLTSPLKLGSVLRIPAASSAR
jgi:LysM repeat protein